MVKERSDFPLSSRDADKYPPPTHFQYGKRLFLKGKRTINNKNNKVKKQKQIRRGMVIIKVTIKTNKPQAHHIQHN